MKTILSTLCYFACAVSLSAQTYFYEAHIDGSKVGDIKAVREVNDEAEKISITISVKLPGTATYLYDFSSFSSYMDGKLVDAKSQTRINGNTTISEVVFKEGSYMSNLGGTSRILKKSTLYGDDLLYFEKPDGLETVYVFETGHLASLTMTSEHIWQIADLTNKRVLTYSENMLTSIAWQFAEQQLVFKFKQ